MNEIVEAINKLGETNCIDYVQLVATVVSVIISAIAVIYAVKVPKKISEEQNRIALFEKRHKFYIAFCNCICLADAVNVGDSKNEARENFVFLFSEKPIQDREAVTINKEFTPLLTKVIEVLNQGVFLFEFETDKWIGPLAEQMTYMLTKNNETSKSMDEQILRYKILAKEAKDHLTYKIEYSINMNRQNKRR